MAYIGITERGDASIDFSWVKALKSDRCNGAVIITKNLNPEMFSPLLEHKEKIVLHCTVTGYGGSVLEPNIPKPQKIYENLRLLLDAGFPKEQVVLRIDPIIPTGRGIKKADAVADVFWGSYERIRISVIDMYPHVRERFKEKNIPCPFGESKIAPKESMELVERFINKWIGKVRVELCAEQDINKGYHTGCVSEFEYRLFNMELPDPKKEESRNRQRTSCSCFPKRELLSEKCRCPYQCLYCYWKDRNPTDPLPKELVIG